MRRKVWGRQTKILLRDVAGQLLPESILRRPKMGFSVPVAQWFMGDLGDRFEELALSPDASLRGLVDQDEVRRMFLDHRAGTAWFGANLWALMMLEMWGRTWLDAPVPTPA